MRPCFLATLAAMLALHLCVSAGENSAPKPTDSNTDHWAFKAPVRSAAPGAKDSAWVRNPIDGFILAKLESLGIKPSPEADRPTLIRRLYLDLVGLPPTPAEVDQFVNDPNPYAYEGLVNRLLASPHFGEQWGRHWLDLARYADSDGFEKDLPRPHAWRYRQWVIDALNRDMPYDEFVVEQLAGDLLPNATVEQKVATGFHRNTLTNREGGVDPEQYRVEQVVDRTNTTSSALLGVTLGCAQCHNHKYDPFTQRDYYRMFAFFNVANESDIPAPLAPEVEAYKQAKARYDGQRAELQKAIDAYKPELASRLPKWESEQHFAEVAWMPLEPTSYTSAGGATLAKQPDHSIFVTGNGPTKDTYTVVVNTPLSGITGIRLEVLTDPRLPKNGPGRAADGNFVLSEFAVKASEPSDPTTVVPLPIRQAWADYAQADYPVAKAIDNKKDRGWAVGGPTGVGANHVAEFALQDPSGFPKGTVLTFVLEQRFGGGLTIGRFRLSATTADKNLVVIPPDVRTALLTPADKRNDAQKDAVLDYFGQSDAKMRELQAGLTAFDKAAPKPPETLAQTIAVNPAPPKTHVLTRGDFLRPGEEVQPGTPAVLPPLKPRGPVADRLDLARWIADPNNPLTARVEVNRIWERLFERGLVYTSEDFGTRGDAPSHPELLDWLATELPARGWSVKELIRLIVTSSTYRQASIVRPELLEKDPKNVWLARQSRFRVEAENTRDLALAASGLLNEVVGGPSVRPPLPPGIAELGYAGSIRWPESQGEDKYRRGIYIFFQRTVPYPMLMTFDCPDSNVTCIRRARSNSPLQALTLLNDPVFFECAQALGRRVLSEAPKDPTERARYAFRVCLGRQPTDRELKGLLDLMKDQAKTYAANPQAASKAAGAPKPPSADTADTATCVSLARVILNLDEFVTRE